MGYFLINKHRTRCIAKSETSPYTLGGGGVDDQNAQYIPLIIKKKTFREEEEEEEEYVPDPALQVTFSLVILFLSE